MFISIYTTFASAKEAKTITEHLLKNKLIACATYFPAESKYAWKNKIETSKEYISFLKTKKSNFTKVKKEIERLHSYDVPCILCLDIKDGNSSYLTWIKEVAE